MVSPPVRIPICARFGRERAERARVGARGLVREKMDLYHYRISVRMLFFLLLPLYDKNVVGDCVPGVVDSDEEQQHGSSSDEKQCAG